MARPALWTSSSTLAGFVSWTCWTPTEREGSSASSAPLPGRAVAFLVCGEGVFGECGAGQLNHRTRPSAGRPNSDPKRRSVLFRVHRSGAIPVLDVAHQPPAPPTQQGAIVVGDCGITFLGAQDNLQRSRATSPGDEFRVGRQRQVGKRFGKFGWLRVARLRAATGEQAPE